MNNAETLATLNIQDKGRKQRERKKTHKYYKH